VSHQQPTMAAQLDEGDAALKRVTARPPALSSFADAVRRPAHLGTA
jgi:hypothetical protein